MDHCKSLTFAIRCAVLGGAATPDKVSQLKRGGITTAIERITAAGEANAQLQLSDVVAQVVFPPLQLVFEAYDLVRRIQMSFPAYRVASRVHPDGDHLQIVVDISDPVESDSPRKINDSATYTYNIGIHSSHLDLFPRLFPGNSLQLPATNTHSSIPHLNLSVSDLSVEGPLSPIFNFDRFFHIIETVNQWKKRGAVEIQKEENKKAKDSLLNLVKAQQVIDYNEILLPYLFTGKHELRITVRVEVMVASIVPMQDSSPMDETEFTSSHAESSSSDTVKIPTEVERKEEVEKKLNVHSHTQLLIYNPPLKRRKSSTINLSSNSSKFEYTSQFSRQSADEKSSSRNGRSLTFKDPVSESIKDDICIGISFKCTLLQLIHDMLVLSGLNR
jgi:hypothetical protein